MKMLLFKPGGNSRPCLYQLIELFNACVVTSLEGDKFISKPDTPVHFTL